MTNQERLLFKEQCRASIIVQQTLNQLSPRGDCPQVQIMLHSILNLYANSDHALEFCTHLVSEYFDEPTAREVEGLINILYASTLKTHV